MKKKVVICLLVIILLISIVNFFKADAASTSGSFKYEVENNEVTIVGLSGTSTNNYVIPEKINNLNVTKIADGAFSNTNIPNNATVTISANIKEIGSEAFKNSTLGAVLIQGNVEKIGANCFENCSYLRKIDIQGTIKSIGTSAFYNCRNLSSTLKLPETVEIGKFAFAGCSKLNTIEIPSTLTNIGEKAFFGTVWLENKQAESQLVVINNILIDGTTYENSILTIPNNIKEIASGAFSDTTVLTKAIIPDSVNINNKDNIFSGCTNLQEVRLPSNIESIGFGMFSDCTNLQTINIPSTVTMIREKAFIGTKWLENEQKINPLVIRNNILIDGSTCQGSVVIPNGIKLIADGAFRSARDITNIKLPDSLEEIGIYAFFECEGISEIEIPSTTKRIDDFAFLGCMSITNLEVPNLEYIGESAFLTLNELNLTFRGDVENIGRDIVFKDMTKLYVRRDTHILEYAIENNLNYEIIGNMLGDLDANKKVNVTDANIALMYAIKQRDLTPTQLIDGDVDFNGKVNVADARRILMYAIKQISSFYE